MFNLEIEQKQKEVQLKRAKAPVVLYEPSAYARTRYLQELMSKAPADAVITDDDGNMVPGKVLGNMLADWDAAFRLVALCIAANPAETISETEVIERLKAVIVDEDDIGSLYDAANALTFPEPDKAMDDADPKA